MKRKIGIISVMIAGLFLATGVLADEGLRAAAYKATQTKRIPTIDWASVVVHARNQRQQGYRFSIDFYMDGGAKAGDMLKATVKLKKKVIASDQCKLKATKWSNGNSSTKVDCSFQKSELSKKAGAFSVDLTYSYMDDQTMAQKDVNVGTVKFAIFKYFAGKYDGNKFQVDLDPRQGEALVGLQKGPYEFRNVWVSFWYKYEGRKNQIPQTRALRCFADGKPMGEMVSGDSKFKRKGSTLYQPFTKANKGLEQIGWAKFVVHTGLSYRKNAKKAKISEANLELYNKGSFIDQNPGSWECKVVFDGKPIRSIKFTVAKGGDGLNHITANPVQKNLYTRWHLADVELKKGWPFEGKDNAKTMKKYGLWGNSLSK